MNKTIYFIKFYLQLTLTNSYISQPFPHPGCSCTIVYYFTSQNIHCHNVWNLLYRTFSTHCDENLCVKLVKTKDYHFIRMHDQPNIKKLFFNLFFVLHFWYSQHNLSQTYVSMCYNYGGPKYCRSAVRSFRVNERVQYVMVALTGNSSSWSKAAHVRPVGRHIEL